MISNNGIKVFIKKCAKEQNGGKVQASPKAIKYLKEILETVARNILTDTLKWETQKRVTIKNIQATMNKQEKRDGFLPIPEVNTISLEERRLSILKSDIRKCNKYKIWKLNALQRDNFVCQQCGYDIAKNLDVHHKKQFIAILNENKIQSVKEAEECDELWDLNNSITLCLNCHRLEYGKYPKKIILLENSLNSKE